MNLSSEAARMADLAAELEESLRGLSYPDYQDQIFRMLGEFLEYYRPVLPEEIITLASDTLRLLEPTVSPRPVEVDRVDRAWDLVISEFRPLSRNIREFCWTLSRVKPHLSGRNFFIGQALSNLLVADIFRPSLPSEVLLPFTGFSVPAEQAEGDLRLLSHLVASVPRSPSDALRRPTDAAASGPDPR